MLRVAVPLLFPGSETEQLHRRRGLGGGRTQRKRHLEEADSSEAARLASRALPPGDGIGEMTCGPPTPGDLLPAPRTFAQEVSEYPEGHPLR